MVGQRPLKPLIVVRIHISQQNKICYNIQMNLEKFFMGRVVGFIILFCIVFIVVTGFEALNNRIYEEKQSGGYPTEPYRGTISGVHVCLRHKDTSVQTKECMSGIQTYTAEYYALDFSLMSQTPPEIRNGQKFTASGVITPIERLSTDQWEKYYIHGIFSVTDTVIIERN